MCARSSQSITSCNRLRMLIIPDAVILPLPIDGQQLLILTPDHLSGLLALAVGVNQGLYNVQFVV